METRPISDHKQIELIAEGIESLSSNARRGLLPNLINQLSNQILRDCGLDKTPDQFEQAITGLQREAEIVREQVYFAQELIESITGYVSELTAERKLTKKSSNHIQELIENSYFEL